MLTFPVKNLFIEGPDCSGKTTLIKKIHKLTDYRWHITDRSQISRKIFSELYSRVLPYDDHLHLEMCDLNNQYVILLPAWHVIEERFKRRGDELHTLESLRSVYDRFHVAASHLVRYPNVIVFQHDDTDDIAIRVASYLDLVERPVLKELSMNVHDFVKSTKEKESLPLQFTLYEDGKFEESDSTILNHSDEGEYYQMIHSSLMKKIKNELAGENEYNRVESLSSRRFVHTDDTCISFVHLNKRDDMIDFNVVIRSSNVKDIFEHDLRFLYFLSFSCYKKIKGASKVRMRFNFNSAHIV